MCSIDVLVIQLRMWLRKIKPYRSSLFYVCTTSISWDSFLPYKLFAIERGLPIFISWNNWQQYGDELV